MSYFQRTGIPAVRGSLFGEPVDYFECMNISPPKTPPVRATAKAAPPPLPLLDPRAVHRLQLQLQCQSSDREGTENTSPSPPTGAMVLVAAFPRWLHRTRSERCADDLAIS